MYQIPQSDPGNQTAFCVLLEDGNGGRLATAVRERPQVADRGTAFRYGG